MKIRSGFVSNSSSSSFICDITGRIESGWDLCMEDAQMVESKWGTYYEEYVIGGIDTLKKQIYQQRIIEDEEQLSPTWEEDKDWLDVEGWRYEIPDEYCPLYNLQYINDAVLLRYLYFKTGQNKEELSKEIKDNYQTLDKLYDALKAKGC